MLRAFIRRLFHLKPYEDSVINRTSGRVRYSLALAETRCAGKHVLDVGASIGWFEAWAQQRGDVAVSAVEINPGALERARANAPDSDYHLGSALELPFPDRSFDGAVMFEVIEHTPRGTESRVLREVRRVLRPGGWFLLSTPNAHPLAMALDPAWYLGHRHYSTRAIGRLITEAGFSIARITVRGGMWELFGTTWLYVFKWIFGAEPPARAAIDARVQREFFDERRNMTNVFVEALADR